MKFSERKWAGYFGHAQQASDAALLDYPRANTDPDHVLLWAKQAATESTDGWAWLCDTLPKGGTYRDEGGTEVQYDGWMSHGVIRDCFLFVMKTKRPENAQAYGKETEFWHGSALDTHLTLKAPSVDFNWPAPLPKWTAEIFDPLADDNERYERYLDLFRPPSKEKKAAPNPGDANAGDVRKRGDGKGSPEVVKEKGAKRTKWHDLPPVLNNDQLPPPEPIAIPSSWSRIVTDMSKAAADFIDLHNKGKTGILDMRTNISTTLNRIAVRD